jgi:hypothetical protein
LLGTIGYAKAFEIDAFTFIWPVTTPGEKGTAFHNINRTDPVIFFITNQ